MGKYSFYEVPTTGMIMILIACLYFNKRVTVTGFDSLTQKKTSGMFPHYFGKKTKHLKDHNFSHERSIFRHLVKLKKVKVI